LLYFFGIGFVASGTLTMLFLNILCSLSGSICWRLAASSTLASLGR